MVRRVSNIWMKFRFTRDILRLVYGFNEIIEHRDNVFTSAFAQFRSSSIRRIIALFSPYFCLRLFSIPFKLD